MDEQSTDHRPLALFKLLDESGIGLTDSSAGLLDERERRLVIGAANFHALAAPGQLLRIIVLRGPWGTFPALTDRTVHHIEWAPYREAVGSMVLRSVVQPLNAVARPTSIQGLVVDVGGGAVEPNSGQFTGRCRVGKDRFGERRVLWRQFSSTRFGSCVPM